MRIKKDLGMYCLGNSLTDKRLWVILLKVKVIHVVKHSGCIYEFKIILYEKAGVKTCTKPGINRFLLIILNVRSVSLNLALTDICILLYTLVKHHKIIPEQDIAPCDDIIDIMGRQIDPSWWTH